MYFPSNLYYTDWKIKHLIKYSNNNLLYCDYSHPSVRFTNKDIKNVTDHTISVVKNSWLKPYHRVSCV